MLSLVASEKNLAIIRRPREPLEGAESLRSQHGSALAVDDHQHAPVVVSNRVLEVRDVTTVVRDTDVAEIARPVSKHGAQRTFELVFSLDRSDDREVFIVGGPVG